MFKSLRHVEFIFMYGVMCVLSSLIYIDFPASPTPFGEETVFFPLGILAPFAED